MKLRKFVTAAALGATVITAVPALAAPHEAAAAACDQLTECGNKPGDDSGEVSDWGWDGPGYWDDGNSAWNTIDISNGGIGEPIPDFPVVVVAAPRIVDVFTPLDPMIPSEWYGSGYTGSSGGTTAIVWSEGKKWNERQKCYRNTGSAEMKVSENVQFQWSVKASTNISASAMAVLTATLGTEVNVQQTHTYGAEVTLKPGDTWALQVEYQTSVYEITTQDFWGNFAKEYVNVTAPTGVMTGTSC